MPDLHIQIIFDDSQGNTGKAIRELQKLDFFLWPELPWWHKPPDNARAIVARILSRHSLRGKLSLMPHSGEGRFDTPPNPVWTGFSPRTNFNTI